MPAWLQRIMDWASVNPGKIIGLIAGLSVFLLLLAIGPMFLIFLVLVGGGFLIGKSMDDNEPIQVVLRKLFGLDKSDKDRFDDEKGFD